MTAKKVSLATVHCGSIYQCARWAIWSFSTRARLECLWFLFSAWQKNSTRIGEFESDVDTAQLEHEYLCKLISCDAIVDVRDSSEKANVCLCQQFHFTSEYFIMYIFSALFIEHLWLLRGPFTNRNGFSTSNVSYRMHGYWIGPWQNIVTNIFYKPARTTIGFLRGN